MGPQTVIHRNRQGGKIQYDGAKKGPAGYCEVLLRAECVSKLTTPAQHVTQPNDRQLHSMYQFMGWTSGNEWQPHLDDVGIAALEGVCAGQSRLQPSLLRAIKLHTCCRIRSEAANHLNLHRHTYNS
jgi:hypothetical protein